MMVKKDDPRVLMGIDHGIIMSPPNYAEMALRGPSLQLTYDNQSESAKSVEIPEEIIDLVQGGVVRKAELNRKLEELQIFNAQEIKSMWLRVQAVLKYKKFLSKMNYQAVTGVTWLGAEYSGRV